MLPTRFASRLPRGPRLRRVLRIALRIVLPLVLLWVGLDLYWNAELQHRLRALHASGQPLSFAEMMPADIPDSQNAAAQYRQKLPYPSIPYNSATDPGDYYRNNDRAHELAAGAYLTTPEAQQALAQVERVAAMPQCVWLPRLEEDEHSFLCGKTRIFVNRAADEAIWLARHGQPDAALHWCAVGVRLARQAETYPGTVGLLVAGADTAIALRPAQEVIEAHRAGAAARRELDAALASIDFTQATVTALRGSIAHLTDLFDDLRAGRKRMRELMIEELMLPNDDKRGRGGNPIWDLYQSWLGRPWLNHDECVYLDLIGPEQAPAVLPSYQGQAAFAAVKVKAPPRWLAPIANDCLQTRILSRMAVKRDQNGANLDLCRLTLAFQTYREAQGRYPETLEAVRAAAPGLRLTDPFSGKSYVYRREGAGFVVYSFGPDMKDDGGKPLQYSQNQDPPQGDIVWRCAR